MAAGALVGDNFPTVPAVTDEAYLRIVHQSGTYADLAGPGSTLAAKMAVEDFMAKDKSLKIRVEGEKEGKKVRHSFEMFDRYDAETDTPSMVRTTGYTCTAMVRCVARNLYTRVGISPPEFVGRDKRCFDFVLKDLEERNVRFRHEVEEI